MKQRIAYEPENNREFPICVYNAKGEFIAYETSMEGALKRYPDAVISPISFGRWVQSVNDLIKGREG